MDQTLTNKLEAWLSKPEHTDDSDIMEGALMLLQLNRNRSLYMTVSTCPKRFVKTVEYELRKFLPMRKQGKTCADVRREADALLKELKSADDAEPSGNESKPVEEMDLPLRSGKRPDHDSLPENIKAIWTENAERWKKIKELYNICLHIEQPCDLAENLQVLKETWYKYKSEFDRYDSYVIGDETEEKETDPMQTARDIANARAYISKNLDRLISMKSASLADGADEKAIKDYQSLLSSVSDRVQILIENKQVMGDDLKKKLTDAGVTLPSEQPSETEL
ncbi:MAG: hypothetical protein PUF37_05785 [Prevotellaceae bacterium]|nr:hypothetical protein [Prevotellaceae bacterium]